MRRHLLGVSTVCLLLSHFWIEPLQAYSSTMYLTQYPPSGFGCDFEAEEIGERLKASGVTVHSTECGVPSSRNGTYTIYINFEKPEDFEEETTSHNSNFYGRGWYRTLEACERDLQKQTNLFQIYTGLQPYVSFCSSESSSYTSYPYWPHIRAIGRGDLHLVVSRLNLKPLRDFDVDSLAERIAKGFSLGDKRLIRTEAVDSEIILSFYTATRSALRKGNLVTFRNLKSCEATIPEIERAYAQSKMPPYALFCAVESKKLVRLVGITDYRRTLDIRTDYYGYTKQADCEASLPGLEDRLKQKGMEPVGSFCAVSISTTAYIPYTVYDPPQRQ